MIIRNQAYNYGCVCFANRIILHTISICFLQLFNVSSFYFIGHIELALWARFLNEKVALAFGETTKLRSLR